MTAARPLEIELKYRVADVRAAERLLEGDAMGAYAGAGPVRTSQLEDRYVDTADGALARAGFAARLRYGSSGSLVTLKSLATEGRSALHRREELEGPADVAFPPHDWPASAARSLLLELAGDAPLVELVTVRQLRRVRPFRADVGAVELSLDAVDVVSHGSIVEHFTELEIELRDGPVEHLEDVAAAIESIPGLEPAPRSKLEAALAAAGITLAGIPADAGPAGEAPGSGPTPDTTPVATRPAKGSRSRTVDPAAPGPEPAPVRPEAAEAGVTAPSAEASVGGPAGEATEAVGASEATEATEAAAPRLEVGRTPGVRSDDTLAEAGRKILRFHLARMLAKEPGTRAGKDPEELHSMRVATRRMRAAWRVFGEAYRPRRERRYVRDLREVAARLGAVRDLDVLIDGLEAYADALPEPERPLLRPLIDSWRAQREEARTVLLRSLDSDAYARFVDEYREFVRTEGLGVLPVTPTTPHRVRDRMPTLIWDAYQQVRAYEPILRWADVETLHALRIAAKRLRYTIEFVREPIGAEAAPLVERVVALQDHLGLLNDADVAASLARQFLVERSASLSEQETAAIGRYLVDRERELARLRRSVGTPWRRVAGLAFRRALGRAVAGL